MTTREDILQFAMVNREVNLIPYLLSVGLARDKFSEVVTWVSSPENKALVCRNYVPYISSWQDINTIIECSNPHKYNIDPFISLKLLDLKDISAYHISELNKFCHGNTNEALSIRQKIVHHPNTDEDTITKIGKKSSKCFWEILQREDVPTDIIKRAAKLICRDHWTYYKNKYENLVRRGKIAKKTQEIISDLMNIKDILE